MAEFIRMLSMVMGRPVVDRTGFTETFDLTLDFTPDEAVAGLPRRRREPPIPAAPRPRPTLPLRPRSSPPSRNNWG